MNKVDVMLGKWQWQAGRDECKKWQKEKKTKRYKWRIELIAAAAVRSIVIGVQTNHGW